MEKLSLIEKAERSLASNFADQSILIFILCGGSVIAMPDLLCYFPVVCPDIPEDLYMSHPGFVFIRIIQSAKLHALFHCGAVFIRLAV
jgi:hypothetical protein